MFAVDFTDVKSGEAVFKSYTPAMLDVVIPVAVTVTGVIVI